MINWFMLTSFDQFSLSGRGISGRGKLAPKVLSELLMNFRFTSFYKKLYIGDQSQGQVHQRKVR